MSKNEGYHPRAFHQRGIDDLSHDFEPVSELAIVDPVPATPPMLFVDAHIVRFATPTMLFIAAHIDSFATPAMLFIAATIVP